MATPYHAAAPSWRPRDFKTPFGNDNTTWTTTAIVSNARTSAIRRVLSSTPRPTWRSPTRMTITDSPPPSATSEHKSPSRGVRETSTMPAMAQHATATMLTLQSARRPALGASVSATATATTVTIAAANVARRSREDVAVLLVVAPEVRNVLTASRVLRV